MLPLPPHLAYTPGTRALLYLLAGKQEAARELGEALQRAYPNNASVLALQAVLLARSGKVGALLPPASGLLQDGWSDAYQLLYVTWWTLHRPWGAYVVRSLCGAFTPELNAWQGLP